MFATALLGTTARHYCARRNSWIFVLVEYMVQWFLLAEKSYRVDCCHSNRFHSVHNWLACISDVLKLYYSTTVHGCIAGYILVTKFSVNIAPVLIVVAEFGRLLNRCDVYLDPIVRELNTADSVDCIK